MLGPEIIYLTSIPAIVQSIKAKFPSYQYLILTDEHICHIHLPAFQAEMQANGLRYLTYILPSGELNKSNDSIVKVQDFMFTNHFNRTDILIALGGGLLTDFGGFVSSTYMRGVAFINVPTTLLSMVDASIGSKTAINTKFGKNLIGSFYDSKAIYINVTFLKSLDYRNFCNGFGEIIKAALLQDRELFERLERTNPRELKAKSDAELEGIIRRSIDIKLWFVLKDKKESHLRKLLNLGHTIGHGVEYALHEELLHGECLGIGMMKMLEIGIRKKIIDESVGFEVTQRLRNVLDKYGLPHKVPSQINLKHVIMNMMSDKKNEAQEIRFVFIKDIGVFYEKSVAVEIPLIMELLSNKIHPVSCIAPKEDTPAFEPEIVGSKSITNRILLLASLGEGTIDIENFLQAEDTEVLLGALRQLGLCSVLETKKNNVVLKGLGLQHLLKEDGKQELVLDVQNSGLSARFLITLLTFLPGSFVLTGNEHLKRRPMGDLIRALRANSNCQITYLGQEDCLPVRILNEKKTDIGLKGGQIVLNSKLSSQYVSSLLLCSVLAQKPVTIRLEDVGEKDEITSEPFIDMTLRLMAEFGVEAKKASFNSYFVPSGKTYKNPAKFVVEPDYTAFSDDLAFVALLGGSAKIQHPSKKPLQNDANFPAEVLTKIGLEVSLEKNTLFVRRPAGKPLNPITVNLNAFPDCFMTLAIIASQISGVTKISGIANQRVKECNRLKTVCQNLIKCGIFAHETSDGLVIHGRALQSFDTNHVQKKKIVIETNSDHRIAMAFTILAAYFEHMNHPLKLLIDDKHCVNKTFPDYYQHLSKTFDMKFEGEFTWNPKREDFDADNETNQNYLNHNYLILVGMRGVGKSATARLIERKLGWKNYDLDEIVLDRFKEKHPETASIAALVEKFGWAGFREFEKQIFYEFMQKTIEKELLNCVISCGGGIIEDEENYQLLAMMDHVVWIESSDLEEIEKVAAQDLSRPGYEKQSFQEVYNRRKGRFQKVSNHIVCVPGRQNVQEPDFANYYCQIEKMKLKQLRSIAENNNYNFLLKENTFFLCVSLEKAEQLTKDEYFYIRNNYTALEITISDFVVNFLGNDLQNASQESLIKLNEAVRHTLSRAAYHLVNFEIIVTLRTEGRKFPMSDLVYNSIIRELRKSSNTLLFDCEYRANNLAFLNEFASQHQNIILSKHFFDEITENDVHKEFEKMYAFAEYHHKSVKLFKFILPAGVNNGFIEDIRHKASSLPMPNLIFKLGLNGRYSRLEAQVYLPVFDSKIMKAVIEGQLQKTDVLQLRRELYLDPVTTKKFYIIGDNIYRSLSPKIHNYLFQKAGLSDHLYDFRNVEKEEDLGKVLQEPDFVGASVTIPYKKAVIKHLDFLIGEAKEIGVVNTVVKCQGKFYGFNTDWFGIFHVFNQKMNELGWTHLKNHVDVKKYVLILGAGATCETAVYTFSKFMNFEILILNRSDKRFGNLESKGVKREHMFGNVKDFEVFYRENILDKPAMIVCVFNTVPNEEAIPMLKKIEDPILRGVFNSKCLVCHLMYYCKETEFLKYARSLGTTEVIYGINMLIHQGRLQSLLFSQKQFSFETIQRHLKS